MKLKKELLFSILSFLCVFIVYILTLAPDVSFTDSGELAAASYVLGVAHPTGYPLFTILGHLWLMLPLPFSVIYQMNLFAAFTTSIAVAVFFLNFLQIFRNFNFECLQKSNINKSSNRVISHNRKINDGQIIILSFIFSLFIGFSHTVWSIGNSIEVYSLHLMLVSIIMFLVLKATIDSTNSLKYLIATAFFIGLGFTNHLTTLMLIPAVLFLFFSSNEKGFDFSKERFKFLTFLLIPLALALSIYIYLPVRSAAFPEINWGWVHRGWDSFLYHVQGKQFQDWMGFNKIINAAFGNSNLTLSQAISEASAIWSDNFGKFFTLLPSQLAWIGIIPFVWGLIICFKRSKKLFYFLALLIATCLFFALNYSIHDIESYFVLAFIAIIFFASIGIFELLSRKPKAIYISLAIPLVLLIMNYSKNDLSNDYLVKEYTRNLVNNLEENAIIVSSQWDYWVSAFWYLQTVEKFRTDIIIIDKELLRRTWYIEHIKYLYSTKMNICQTETDSFLEQLKLFEAGQNFNPQLIQQQFLSMINCWFHQNYNERPLYITRDVLFSETNDPVDADAVKGFVLVPNGLSIKLEKEDKIYPINIDMMDFSLFAKSYQRTGKNHLVEGIKAQALYYLLNETAQYAINTGQTNSAIKAFELALQIDNDNQRVRQALQQLKSEN